MTDQKLLPALPAPDPERALYSKISRLPHDIRDQLNQRLLDNKSAREILAWLNGLPPVKEILAAQFKGVAINGPNLTHWRQTGYARWLRCQMRVNATKDLCKFAGNVTEAGGGLLAPAAATVASGKILEFLDAADPEKTNPDDLVKCAVAASTLLKGEHTKARISIARERLRQRDLQLILKRDKQQRDLVALGLRLLGDQRAKEIEASNYSNAEKIELLGIHMFDDLWEPRPVPAQTPPQPNQSIKPC